MRKSKPKFMMLFLAMVMFASLAVKAGDNELHQQARQVMLALYNFEFNYADSLILSLEYSAPDHYLPHLTRAHYYWWEIISQEMQPETQKLYLTHLDKAELRVKSMVRSRQLDEYDVFHIINLYALKARLDLINGEYRTAIGHMKQCVSYLKNSLGQEDDYPHFNLTSGLYNYMTDYGSNRFPLFAIYTLLYPRGNMQKGLAQLQTATLHSDPAIQAESHYFLMKIFLELEKDFEAALVHARWLANQYPQNLIYLYHYYELLSNLQMSARAADVKDDFYEILQNHKHLNASQRSYLRELL